MRKTTNDMGTTVWDPCGGSRFAMGMFTPAPSTPPPDAPTSHAHTEK